MCLQYIFCCCDWETTESLNISSNHHGNYAYRPPLSCDNDTHSTVSFHEPLLQEMCMYPPPLTVPCKTDLLTRHEFYSLSEQHVIRLMNAITHMIKNCKNEPPYFSSFFQLASYKKWSTNCATYIPKYMMHLWYRAYLYDFEVALQQADIQCGNDGKITLPYLDIKRNPCIPDVFKDFKFPDHMIYGNDELCKVNMMVNDNEIVPDLISSINISQYIQNDNIEELIDKIIDAYGFNNTDYASLNPCFFLVLCFIDKIFDKHSKYKMNNVTPKSVEYWKILVPFRKLPIELVETANLGYKYS